MDHKAPVKDGERANKTLAQIENDSDEKFYNRQKLRHQWVKCHIKYVRCDSCEKLAGEQVPHQICGACAVAICRDCVTAGKMKLYPTHPQKSVGELDWKPASVISTKNKAGQGPAQVNNIASGTGSRGQRDPDMATPVRQNPAGPAASSFNGSNTPVSKGASSRKGKANATAGLGSSGGPKQIQTFLTSNENSSLILSTQTKKKNSTVTLSDRDSDSDYGMDTQSTSSSDKEYIPRTELGRKSSTPSKKSTNETASPCSSVNNPPVTPVGLANSRPVRASTIQTYEKMRQANVKKQRDVDGFPAAFDEEHNTKSDLKVAPCVHNTRFNGHTTSVENLTGGDKTDGYAQQGAVYGGTAFLYASEEAQQLAGYGVKNRTQTYQHKGLPQLHPGPGPRAQSKTIEFLVPLVTSNDKKRAAALKAEAPSPKRHVASSQSFTPVSKAELSAASTKAIKEAESSIRASIRQITPAERDANRVFVTAGLDGLAAAIEHKVRLRLLVTGFRTMQDAEIELRNAIHGAWVSNMALTHIKRTDGALAAMQILRGYANLVMMRMQMIGSGLLKNWIDATEKGIQDRAAFVPNELRIQTIEPAVQEGFKFKIGEADVYVANVLAEMKNSTS
ncbi:hypothetical protein CGRA01v4_05036 [Colletotrichum graminicola]|uniref:Uncharacterized protein n=1 Tax=Colletotrichum graminicola (strain M1.001 / M2 / FGSC 10212) TaxID=645133 RepID=E3QEK6_COLGM|nr:uncharacterized protein GLRG_04456 [Colletotrichum graminicola M1.001]EFQ29312.1 hypothetical protein GLRG_04456 [Colletotrichum graminicola M1.001]WDK13755.1 hypothetical protein CGRA01v4_05036 [Colletotrichum graminicola]